MTTNTQQKAPGATNATGLNTDTNASDYRNTVALKQATDANAIATQVARLALRGHVVHKGSHGDFTVCKYGLTRYCENFAELMAFARQVGVK